MQLTPSRAARAWRAVQTASAYWFGRTIEPKNPSIDHNPKVMNQTPYQNCGRTQTAMYEMSQTCYRIFDASPNNFELV